MIGDDDPIFLKELEEAVRRCLTEDGLALGRDFETVGFQSPEALADAMRRQEKPVHLLLLDVEFGDANGLALAAKFREQGGTFSLIYITNYEDYVFDSFDTRPLHYLLKPPRKEKLATLLREDYRRQFYDDRLYLRSGAKHLSIPYRDIYAAEAAQHRVFLHTREGTIEWPGALSALAAQLPLWCFCQCHFSYYVNVTHISEIVRFTITLDNGETLPVSKRYFKPTFEQYLSFLKQ